MLIRIVAEIGVNWDGDLEAVKHMMQSSKDVGCNYVKFQAFNEDVIKEHPEKERLMKATITSKNIEEINSISKLVGIEWFCTPMYEEAVDFLDPYVNRYKIRVADGRSLITNKPSKLVNRVLDTRKEVIVSAESNPTQSIQYDNSDIKWLYGVSKNPCTFEDLYYENIDYEKEINSICLKKEVPCFDFKWLLENQTYFSLNSMIEYLLVGLLLQVLNLLYKQMYLLLYL